MTTNHLEDGIALGHNARNRPAGIEILDSFQRLENTETLKQVVFEKVPAREIENQIVAR